VEAVMNEYMMRRRLIEGGKTWEEAEDRLRDLAEERADDERDRRAEEFFKTRVNGGGHGHE
jgi:hypothetical protein